MDVIQSQFDAAVITTEQYFNALNAARTTRDNLLQIINAQKLLASMSDEPSMIAAISAMNETISILQAKLNAL